MLPLREGDGFPVCSHILPWARALHMASLAPRATSDCNLGESKGHLLGCEDSRRHVFP